MSIERHINNEDLTSYLGYYLYLDPSTGLATCRIQGPVLPESVGPEGLWCFTPGKLLVLEELTFQSRVKSPDGVEHQFPETRWRSFYPDSREGFRFDRVKRVIAVDALYEIKGGIKTAPFPKTLVISSLNPDHFLHVSVATQTRVPFRSRLGSEDIGNGYRVIVTCPSSEGGLEQQRVQGANVSEYSFLRNRVSDQSADSFA